MRYSWQRSLFHRISIAYLIDGFFFFSIDLAPCAGLTVTGAIFLIRWQAENDKIGDGSDPTNLKAWQKYRRTKQPTKLGWRCTRIRVSTRSILELNTFFSCCSPNDCLFVVPGPRTIPACFTCRQFRFWTINHNFVIF